MNKRLNEENVSYYTGKPVDTRSLLQDLKSLKDLVTGSKPAAEQNQFMQMITKDITSVGDALKWLLVTLWNGFKGLFTPVDPSIDKSGVNLDAPTSERIPGKTSFFDQSLSGIWGKMVTGLQNMFKTFGEKATQIQAEGLDTKIITGGQMSVGTGLRVGFLGSLVAFAVYKVVKWVRGSKKEETVEALNSNVHEFKNKLNEGFDFSNNLIARILESENTTSNAVATIKKAKPVADELADFAQEAEEKKETEQSIIKKYGYWILGGIAAIAATFVYLGLFASSKAPYQQAWSGGKPVTPIKDPKPYQKAWSGPVKSATPTTDLTGGQDVVPGVHIS